MHQDNFTEQDIIEITSILLHEVQELRATGFSQEAAQIDAVCQSLNLARIDKYGHTTACEIQRCATSFPSTRNL